MKQNTKDWLFVISVGAGLVLIVGLIIFGVWARVAAPCDKIDWMPVSDLPGRCLPGGRG